MILQFIIEHLIFFNLHINMTSVVNKICHIICKENMHFFHQNKIIVIQILYVILVRVFYYVSISLYKVACHKPFSNRYFSSAKDLVKKSFRFQKSFTLLWV